MERENQDVTPLSGKRYAFDIPRSLPLRRVFEVFFGNGGGFRVAATRSELEGKRQQLLDVLVRKHNPDLEKELLKIENDLFNNG